MIWDIQSRIAVYRGEILYHALELPLYNTGRHDIPPNYPPDILKSSLYEVFVIDCFLYDLKLPALVNVLVGFMAPVDVLYISC